MVPSEYFFLWSLIAIPWASNSSTLRQSTTWWTRAGSSTRRTVPVWWLRSTWGSTRRRWRTSPRPRLPLIFLKHVWRETNTCFQLLWQLRSREIQKIRVRICGNLSTGVVNIKLKWKRNSLPPGKAPLLRGIYLPKNLLMLVSSPMISSYHKYFRGFLLFN